MKDIRTGLFHIRLSERRGVGQGDTYEEALADVESAINFHIETFGDDAFETDSPVLEAFIAETQLAA